MTPEKTGAVFLLKEYGQYVVCDFFLINDVAILRCTTNEPMFENPRDELHGEIYEVEQWWKDKPYGIVISRKFKYTAIEGKKS
jgi:hypothetical protein